MRLGRYKLLEYYENGTLQLFDLLEDVGEQTNIADAKPKVTAELVELLKSWRESVDAKMPFPKTSTSKPARSSRVKK